MCHWSTASSTMQSDVTSDRPGLGSPSCTLAFKGSGAKPPEAENLLAFGAQQKQQICFILHILSCSKPWPTHQLTSSWVKTHRIKERPLAKVGWTCPPQSTPWRRPCLYCSSQSGDAYSSVTVGVIIRLLWSLVEVRAIEAPIHPCCPTRHDYGLFRPNGWILTKGPNSL